MQFLSNLTIRGRLFLISGSFLLSMVCCIGIGSWQIYKSGQELIEIAELKIPLVEQLTKATIHQLHIAIEVERYLRHPKIEVAEAIRDSSKKTVGALVAGKTLIDSRLDLAISEKDLNKLQSYSSSIGKMLDQEDLLKQHLEELIAASEVTTSMAQSIETETLMMSELIEKLTIAVEKDTVEVALHAEHAEIQAMRTIIVLGVVFSSLSFFLATIVGKTTVRSVADLSDRVAEISNKIGSSSQELTEIGQKSKNLLFRQDSNIEETSSSTEEIRQMAESNVATTQRVREYSTNSTKAQISLWIRL